MSRLDTSASQQFHHQPKRSASAELPSSLAKSAAAVPPKKRARNQRGEAEDGEADADETATTATATAAVPLDLSAGGREKSRGTDGRDAESQSIVADSIATSGTPSAGAAAAAAAYMARCTESLRSMGLAAPPEDPAADSWLAMSHWQASLHAQYLYYSSLALSGFLPPPPPPQPYPIVSSVSKPPLSQSSLISPDYGSLFASPTMSTPSLSAPQPQVPPPPPPMSSRSQRPAPDRTPSPARQHSTPQSHHQQQHQQQQQPQQPQRRIKACRATVGTPAASPTLGVPKPSAAAASSAERQTSGETDFQCSCGKAFASLIGLTLHLKETGHGPGSSYNRDRDIPKLVRGQDMWINSETEQTREILRCIRCKQSFRTLPELTMHMMKTRHYTEIIYTDAAPPPQQSAASSVALRLPGSQSAKEDRTGTNSKEQRPQAAGCPRSGRAEVKEADSATDPQPRRHQAAEESGGATSTLQKMQHFVEASLPRSGLRRPGMFQEVLQNSLFDGVDRGGESDIDDDQLREGDGANNGLKAASGDAVSYLSPDRPPDPKENPLSSLQKLVDTAEKTSTAAAACLSMTASASATGVSAQASAPPASATPATVKSPGSPAAEGASATGVSSSRHTVIMLSPTYIYQGGMYPPFPVCHPSALLGGSGGGGGGGCGPMDLSKLPAAKQQRSDEAPTYVKKSSTSVASTSATSGGAGAAEAADKAASGSSWPESLMQKKAKCHYCSKPFANKGQVRLHISKGKCPSLLARLPTAALPPFPFFPAMDYIKAAGGRFHAAPAAAPASGKELQA